MFWERMERSGGRDTVEMEMGGVDDPGRPRSCWIAGDANQPKDRQGIRLVVSHDQQDAGKKNHR